MKIVEGNLIELARRGEYDVFVHGCNCFLTMGAGIAAQIAKTFPAAYAADLCTASGHNGKLGKISFAKIGGHLDNPTIIVNAYTQFMPGANVDYAAIGLCFENVRAMFTGKRIAYPKIGAGIGGGDWNRIAQIIDGVLAGEDHTLIVFTKTHGGLNEKDSPR